MNRLAALESALEQVQLALTKPNSDLTTRQIRAFLMLAKASLEGDPLTTEDLRRFLNLSSQTAHKTVSYFVELGLVERQRVWFDQRAKHLALTQAGRAVAESLNEAQDVKRVVNA